MESGGKIWTVKLAGAVSVRVNSSVNVMPEIQLEMPNPEINKIKIRGDHIITINFPAFQNTNIGC
jgi:hypothetical protein